MLSAVHDEKQIVECLSSGADDYLLKPINRGELLAKVSVALRRRTQRQAADMGLHPGARFAGCFEIDEQIGAGGFSTVFRAHDVRSRRPVALKIFDLPPRQRGDTNFIAGFLREAYGLAKLDHPSIVKFLDFGQTGRFHYLVMEYLQGASLEEIVDDQGALAEPTLAIFGHHVASAIGYLASHGMVHRDIKPANILLATDGAVKLLDFGLAKSVSDATLTLPDEVLVTPVYAAPEAFEKKQQLDARADIYSLGATLHYAATGRLPFPGETFGEIMASHFQHRPPAVAELNPAISQAVSDLIDRMLAVHVEDRPSVDEVIAALGARL
jgi:serine/threonine-protein kinase